MAETDFAALQLRVLPEQGGVCGIELLAAVEAVRQGRRFVSAGLAGYVPAEPADRHDPRPLHSDEVLGSAPETGD